MKKPINPMALIFWCVAAVFIVGDVPIALAIRNFAKMAAEAQEASGGGGIPLKQSLQMVDSMTLLNVWSETRSALLGGGQLIGLGVLIEIVDQIRWNALPPERQIRKRRLANAIRRMRNAGLPG
jgi:hypothetical protein